MKSILFVNYVSLLPFVDSLYYKIYCINQVQLISILLYMNFYTIASIIREISLYILTLRYLSISFYTLFPLHFSFIFGYKFIFILIFIHYIGVWWEFMNFYSPIFLNGITYITFTHFLPPPFLFKMFILIQKHILFIHEF